ncbi:MAG: ActD-like protein [Myxococcaceae bacterium]
MNERARIPQWLLERIALGEVPKRYRKAMKDLPDDANVPEQLGALRAADEALLSRLPPERFSAEVRRRQARKAQERDVAPVRWLTAALVPVAAAVLFVVLQPRATEQERLKGASPHLVVYRRQGSTMERLPPPAVARAGDQLQLRYVAAAARHGFVFSVDGAGQVTVHWPRGQATSGLLEPAAEVTLPHSYQLDAAPRFERFFFVTSAEPFDVKPVLAAAQNWVAAGQDVKAPLTLPAGLSQSAFFVEKQP